MNRLRVILTAIGLTVGVAALAQEASLEPRVQTSAPADTSAPSTAPSADKTPASPGAADKSASHAAGSGARTGAAQRPAAAVPAAAAKGSDRIELGTTQISGNRELPKVMYVVPWRRPEIGDYVGRPPNSLIDEALTPVDREVFQRQNRYFAALQARTASAKSQPGGAEAHPAAVQPKDER